MIDLLLLKTTLASAPKLEQNDSDSLVILSFILSYDSIENVLRLPSILKQDETMAIPDPPSTLTITKEHPSIGGTVIPVRL